MPSPGETGHFWENRGEGYHCGIDFFADENSNVIAIDSGLVIDKGIYTSREKKHFYFNTFYLTIKSSENINYKYASLSEVYVNVGDFIDAGSEIGKIGLTVDKNRVSNKTPFYIREQIQNNRISKLHLELFKSPISEVRPYYAGTFLGQQKPLSLIDPLVFLSEIQRNGV